MKKFGISAFIVSFIMVIGAITFFALKKDNFDGDASGIPLPDEQRESISVFVDYEFNLLVGQTKQLYLTIRPSNATVEFSFITENIADLNKIDNYYFLTGQNAGQTTLTIKVTHEDQVHYENIDVTVIAKNVDFLIMEEVFFAGEAEDYVMIISSNFQIENSAIEICENIVIKNISQQNNEDNFTKQITFCLLEASSFQFKVLNFLYENCALKKPSFEVCFYENCVYDENSKLITLYSNIANQNLAQQNGHSKVATFTQDLADFNLQVNNNQVAKIEDNSLIATENGTTFLEVFSKIDSSFYLKLNISVKSLALSSFDVYINNNLIITNQPIKLLKEEQVVLSIDNFLPNYAYFELEKQFILSNENIVFDEISNTIIAKDEGFVNLKIEINSIIKTIYFEVEKLPEEVEPDIFVLSFSFGSEKISILFNEEKTVNINTSIFEAVYQLELKRNEEIISTDFLSWNFSRELNNADEFCEKMGSAIFIGLIENMQIKFFYLDYVFTLNFIFD